MAINRVIDSSRFDIKRMLDDINTQGVSTFDYLINRVESMMAESIVEQDESLSPPNDFMEWAPTVFPNYFTSSMAQHHIDFWEWVWSIKKGAKPRPYVLIIGRSGGKSTSATAAATYIGAEELRPYIWYLSGTQDQADQHLEAKVMPMLESAKLRYYYPKAASPKIGMHGKTKGWRRNRLWTNLFVIDAIGLDTAQRGRSIEQNRPGLIIPDDIDSKHDSMDTIKKKKEILTNSVLPAGSHDSAFMFVQNLIHPRGIASFLSRQTEAIRAWVTHGILRNEDDDFLVDRIINGPHKAVNGLSYDKLYDKNIKRNRFFITSGVATWEGQPIELCEKQINEWGPTSFIEEAQNELSDSPGGVFSNLDYIHCNPDEVPDLVRGCVWVDPAVTDTKKSDSHGIQADGISADGIIYRLKSWEQVTSPLHSLRKAILMCLEFGFTVVGVETDQGGDTWKPVYKQAWESIVLDWMKESILEYIRGDYDGISIDYGVRVVNITWETLFHKAALELRQSVKYGNEIKNHNGEITTVKTDITEKTLIIEYVKIPKFKSAKAGSGHGSKVERASRMLPDYERGRIIHVVGTHDVLERALYRFPITKPYDLVDASYWSWHHLRNKSTMLVGSVGLSKRGA